MGILSRILRRSAPAPAQRCSYDAATPARARFNGGANRFISYGPETVAASPSIRSRARHVAENNALAAAAVASWTDATIGPGIMPTSQHPDPETRALLDNYFARWVKRADAQGRADFYGLQRRSLPAPSASTAKPSCCGRATSFCTCRPSNWPT
ncbi:phage portal protein [Paracoccus aminovorans]|uniref:phage portal protein n=1 Tax=Paracoccus aminovorans TaxID=34004 RepID=UPI0007845ED1|nr:phage portal protein [Paracoccus aminovorans]